MGEGVERDEVKDRDGQRKGMKCVKETRTEPAATQAEKSNYNQIESIGLMAQSNQSAPPAGAQQRNA